MTTPSMCYLDITIKNNQYYISTSQRKPYLKHSAYQTLEKIERITREHLSPAQETFEKYFRCKRQNEQDLLETYAFQIRNSYLATKKKTTRWSLFIPRLEGVKNVERIFQSIQNNLHPPSFLSNLPDDLSKNILGFLPLKTLFQVNCVSRAGKNLTRSLLQNRAQQFFSYSQMPTAQLTSKLLHLGFEIETLIRHKIIFQSEKTSKGYFHKSKQDVDCEYYLKQLEKFSDKELLLLISHKDFFKYPSKGLFTFFLELLEQNQLVRIEDEDLPKLATDVLIKGIQLREHSKLSLEAFQLLHIFGANFNVLINDRTTTTALLWAVKNRNNKIVDYLLKHGASAKATILMLEETPLWCAVSRQDLSLATRLLERGASVDASGNKHGSRTPLILAILREDVDMVKLLIQNRANINARNKGLTPLHYAVSPYGNADRNYKIAEILLDHGANPNVGGEHGTPCTYLARRLSYRRQQEHLSSEDAERYFKCYHLLQSRGGKASADDDCLLM